jgi:phage antirepressor YoqD-like protein
MQNVRFVSEGDLYRLLASSRLPGGERFESWVFDEVMPSIRKHGAYATPATIESIISDPSSGIKLLEALQAEREQKVRAQHDVARLAPKAQALDDFSDESGTYSVGGAAKLLANSGISIGENRLWDRLKLMGWVFRADGYWMAKQSRIDAGHLSMLQKPGSYQGRNGQSHSYHPQVRITRKGLVLLHRKITENQLVNQMGGDQ